MKNRYLCKFFVALTVLVLFVSNSNGSKCLTDDECEFYGEGSFCCDLRECCYPDQFCCNYGPDYDKYNIYPSLAAVAQKSKS